MTRFNILWLAAIGLALLGCPTTDDTDDTTVTDTDADTDSDADGDTDVDSDVTITFEITAPDVFGWYGVNPPDDGTASVTVNGETAGSTVYTGETVIYEETVPYGETDTYKVELEGMGIICAPLEFDSEATTDETIEVTWLDDQCAWTLETGDWRNQYNMSFGWLENGFDDMDGDGDLEATIDGSDYDDFVVSGNTFVFGHDTLEGVVNDDHVTAFYIDEDDQKIDLHCVK